MDIEGYVVLHTNPYSVLLDWIGRRVEVRETKDKIDIQLDARRLVMHHRIAEAEPSAECRPNTGRRAAAGADAPIRTRTRTPLLLPRPSWPNMSRG